MTMFHPLIAPALVLLSFLFIASWLSRSNNIETVKKNLHLDIVEKISPLVIGNHAPIESLSSDALLNAIGGKEGLIKIRESAGAAATFAAKHVLMNPSAHNEAQELFINATYLRIISILCLIEYHFHKIAPMIQRPQMWAYARLYCEVACSFESTFSAYAAPQSMRT